MKYYSKDINGKVTEISEDTKDVFCYNNNLTELKLPKGVEYVYCNNNKLTKLELPKGVKTFHCWDNNLTELELPKGIEFVHCDYIKNISKQFNKVENKVEINIK